MSPCIESTYYKDAKGYPRRWINGTSTHESRVVYCEYHGIALGSIKGLVIRHQCHNPRCINPAHLLLGTHKDNMQDCIDAGRLGNRGRKEKLTLEQQAAIKKDFRQNKIIAKEYEVTGCTIARIKNKP